MEMQGAEDAWFYSLLVQSILLDNVDCFEGLLRRKPLAINEDINFLCFPIGSKQELEFLKRTPLMIAAMANSPKVVNYIVRSAMANILKKSYSDGATAIDCAVDNESCPTIILTLQYSHDARFRMGQLISMIIPLPMFGRQWQDLNDPGLFRTRDAAGESSSSSGDLYGQNMNRSMQEQQEGNSWTPFNGTAMPWSSNGHFGLNMNQSTQGRQEPKFPTRSFGSAVVDGVLSRPNDQVYQNTNRGTQGRIGPDIPTLSNSRDPAGESKLSSHDQVNQNMNHRMQGSEEPNILAHFYGRDAAGEFPSSSNCQIYMNLNRRMQGQQELRCLKTSNQTDSKEPDCVRIKGEVDVEAISKLEKCLVGITRKFYEVNVLKENLITNGVFDVKIRKISGWQFLLEFDDVETLKKMEQLNWSSLKEWFIKIDHWSRVSYLKHRTTLVAIYGVPIYAWNYNTFKRIAENWGELVSMESDSLNTEDFSKAAMLITTCQPRKIDEVFSLECGENENHIVRIMEIDDGNPICLGNRTCTKCNMSQFCNLSFVDPSDRVYESSLQQNIMADADGGNMLLNGEDNNVAIATDEGLVQPDIVLETRVENRSLPFPNDIMMQGREEPKIPTPSGATDPAGERPSSSDDQVNQNMDHNTHGSQSTQSKREMHCPKLLWETNFFTCTKIPTSLTPYFQGLAVKRSI